MEMKIKLNLWNMTDGKTKETIKYIQNLMPRSDWSSKKTQMFEQIKNKALKSLTANDMLKIIGYRPNKLDYIYIKIMKEKD